MHALQVALLAGPPGVGKTTLAHVAAAHAGYSVLEVNASDDRTPTSLAQRLDAACGVRAAVQSFYYTADGASNDQQTQKPICVVLDEIDGAPAVPYFL